MSVILPLLLRPQTSDSLIDHSGSDEPLWDDFCVTIRGPLAPLLNGDLDMVSFVRDYVEVRIDYNVLRCMTGPIVQTDADTVRFPDHGSRDALCGLIGGVVLDIDITADAIELSMDSGRRLVLPLDETSRTLPDGRIMPEAVHFVPADERGRLEVARMVIW